jgi:hypothetical protein
LRDKPTFVANVSQNYLKVLINSNDEIPVFPGAMIEKFMGGFENTEKGGPSRGSVRSFFLVIMTPAWAQGLNYKL